MYLKCISCQQCVLESNPTIFPAQDGCMRQVLRAGALERPRGMGLGEGIRMGDTVNPWLIHVNVCQKPLQYCKVISLQLIKINGKTKNKSYNFYQIWQSLPFNWVFRLFTFNMIIGRVWYVTLLFVPFLLSSLFIPFLNYFYIFMILLHLLFWPVSYDIFVILLVVLGYIGLPMWLSGKESTG